MPVLSHVLLTTGENDLVLRSTDLEVTYTGRCHAEVEDPGELCLPAKKLATLVKLMPAEHLQLEAVGGDVELTAAQVRYTLCARDAEDFPPGRPNTVLPIYLEDAAALRRALGRVAYAAGEDKARSNICGVHLEIMADGAEHVLRLVATDGHRLALADLELSAEEVPDLGAGLLLPTKSVSAMHRVLNEGTVTLGLSHNLVNLNTNGDLLEAIPLEHTYPDFTTVIPQEHKFRAIAAREALVEAIKRVEAMTNKEFGGVDLSFTTGGLELSSRSVPGRARRPSTWRWSGRVRT